MTNTTIGDIDVKFRIVTNGTHYRLQEKVLCFWLEFGRLYGKRQFAPKWLYTDFFYDINFKDEDGAKSALDVYLLSKKEEWDEEKESKKTKKLKWKQCWTGAGREI